LMPRVSACPLCAKVGKAHHLEKSGKFKHPVTPDANLISYLA